MRFSTIILLSLLPQLVQSAAADTTDSISHVDTIVRHKSIIDKVVDYFSESNKPKSDKPIDFSIIGGPSYSADTKLSIAALGAALYKTSRDSATSVSEATAYVQGAITGYYQVGIRGTHFARADKWRLNYDVDFESYPTYFWGIGYEHDIEDSNETKFKQLSSQVDAAWEWQLASNLYLGPAFHFQYTKATDIREWESASGESAHPASALDLWRGEDLRQLNIGIGFNISYDTRDYVSNAYSGIYLCLEQRFFPKMWLNDKFFGSTELTANSYHKLWHGAVLATQIHAHFTYGATPWNMLPYFGGSRSMRGYYKARFRDKNEADFTLELRQHIWRRNSIAIWGGAGNVFPSFSDFKLRHTLPNYGIGYRWEFKKRTNVRVDYGFGRHCSGLEFSISEVF